ncbi:MAG: peptide chain release factor N(5)-glutamine methyltransferase [Acidimicrobiales bacterium]
MTSDRSEPDPADGTISWRELRAEAEASLAEAVRLGRIDATDAALEARWICEEASGIEGAEWVLGQDAPATVRGVARLDAMVGRRCAGEPVQHVLGHWPFRTLDLLVDGRALIPRPETEQVVEVAIAELDRVVAGRPAGHRAVVADLGTGTGAIALSIAVERPGTEVWATDRSPEALALARANLAALGMAGTRVRVVQGDWYAALGPELRGALDLVVSNPPYVAADEDLARSVLDWEPHEALVPGPTGLEAYEVLLAGAADWLAPGGAVVLEIGATQADAVAALAVAAGLGSVGVAQDLAGLDRTVVARRGAVP